MYKPNGSGRDSYISSNSGGFRVDAESLKYNSFQDNLRSHMPSLSRTMKNNNKTGKIVVKKIDWFSPKVKSSLRRTRYLQDRHSKELSIPKLNNLAAQFISGSQRFRSTLRSKNASVDLDLKQKSVDLPVKYSKRQSRMQEMDSNKVFKNWNL